MKKKNQKSLLYLRLSDNSSLSARVRVFSNFSFLLLHFNCCYDVACWRETTCCPSASLEQLATTFTVSADFS